MTGLRLALVGDPDWSHSAYAQRALTALVPEAQVLHLPPGAAPTPDLDGVWLLVPPPGADPQIHDTTISWALHLGLPLIGPLGGGEGGSSTEGVVPLPWSRMTTLMGAGPLELPALATGARSGGDYLAPEGTSWFVEAHRGTEPAVVTAGSAPFVMLVDHPLATEVGLHPLLTDFVAAVRTRAARRSVPVAAAMGPRLAPLPDDEPRSYVHQMRTGGYRWWRPLLALAAGTGTFVALALVLSIAWFLLDPTMFSGTTSPEDVDLVAPVPMLVGNLMLAALIPAALVATRVGHWRPMGKLFSVAGGIRWRWLARASLITLVIWGGYLALAWFLDGQVVGERPAHWGWLIVITLLTTPLQAAGEEVAFRGALLQGVGAWIGRPVLALVVGTALSATLFALAHTSLDPWVLLDLGIMAIACCYLTWRTGGLEAAIVLHVVNNVVIIIGLTLLGGLEDAYVTEATTSTAGASGLSGLSTLLMTLILLHQAKRVGVAPKKRFAPAVNLTPTRDSMYP